jgi:hypothetical protein
VIGKSRFRPWMTPAEVAILGRLLESRIRPVRVLEWGSGNSTLYFSQMLQRGVEYTWDAVESNNGSWNECPSTFSSTVSLL